MNMDVQNKLEYQFLNVEDLNDEERQNIIDILKPDANTNALKLPGDTEYNLDSNSTGHELQNHWPQNDPVEEYIKCDSSANEIYMPSMPPTYPYGQVVSLCSEWSPQVYLGNVAPDAHVPSYMTGMPYAPHPGYNMGAEMHEVTPTRENNGRRFSKGRGMKRDMYRINQMNEIPPGFIGEQPMHSQLPMMYHPLYINQLDHPVTPQPPMAFYYTTPMPPQTATHMHPPQSYHHHHHHTSQNMRHVRHSPQNLSQPTQETPKTRKGVPQNTYAPAKPTYQSPEDDNNPSHINIDTRVIVNNSNNKLDSCAENVEENTANRKTVNNNNKVSPVNVKIEHNIVSTVNENCTGTEKNDVPCVNINSSIEVKQNGETDKEFKNETVSSIKTTVVKTLSKPTSKTSESDIQNETCIPNKSLTDQEITAKVPNTLQAMSAAPQVTAPVNKSWASIVKKENIDLMQIPSKPMARINPLPPNSVENTSKIPTSTVQKDHPINVTPVSNCDNRSPDLQITNNEFHKTFVDSTQNQCDDPTIFRMGEFLLNYQMDKQTVSLLPRGLTNRSNYCYINSILQALLACPPFYNLLMAVPCPKNPSKNSSIPLISNMVKFVQEFTPLSDAARLPRKDRAHKRGEDNVVDIQYGVAFEPSYVYTMLQNTSAAGGFSVEGKQEDAEEFLSCLLNGINDEMLELMKLVNNNDQNTTTEVEQPANSGSGEEEWKVMGPKNKGSITRCTKVGRTPLSDIFRGQLRTKVSRTGEQTTDNIQPFFTLQLDIEKAESVKEALEILVGRDPLEGMTCSKTNQQIEAWKTVTLEELPIILILHLKWFDYKLDGCSKILKSVKFPVDLRLDGKIITNNIAKKLVSKQKQYKLFAVTYHDGKEATKGHYVTDAWHVGYGNWVRYDDSTLKGVSESSVLNPNPPRVPYLLYYRRCDTIGSQTSKSR